MFSYSGRSDFDNIDNEALDFEQLEAFIQNNTVVHSPAQTAQTGVENNQINPTNLPESPPDSGSEPPYSPNVKGGTQQNIQIDHNALSMSTLTELHVPHHGHHHNLLTPSSELYLASDQQQQLLQINNLLHKHDGSILHTPTQDHQMLLYQVNQHGQIMELNQHHNLSSITNNGSNSRLYKSDIMDITDASAPLSTMHDIQQTIHSSTINDNLPIMIGGSNNSNSNGDNPYPRSMVTSHDQQLSSLSNGSVSKKRKCLSQNSYNNDHLKSFVKSESSKLIDDRKTMN